MPTFEQTLNQEIATVLNDMRRGWEVNAEETGIFRDGGGRPDMVVQQQDRPAVLIENEFMPARNVEAEAIGRLGRKMQNGDIIQAVIALRSPDELRTIKSSQLKKPVAAATFDYALFTGKDKDSVGRFPKNGWLGGSLADLSDFIYRASVPADLLKKLVDAVEHGVGDATQATKHMPKGIGKKIGNILQQQDGEQTRRMAMVILLNALIFQEIFADSNIHTVADTRRDGITKQPFLDEWQKILNINYWPIFGVAYEILIAIPEKYAQQILERLIKTSTNLARETSSSHDIFGSVFQRLITDRKFLATFYTRPASAALLANLAVPQNAPFDNGSWKEDAGNYMVADFACGTGALLSAVYRRIAELHERDGGDMKKTHKQMMEHAMIGCDVMPAAAHLTSSILAGMHPEQPFEETRLYIVPYGEPQKNVYRIGALELLHQRSFLPVISPSAKKAGGRGNIAAETKEILWDSPHLVIMNPPFTRPTKAVKDIINPAFAAFGASAKLQEKLGERNKRLRAGTCGSGNAGLASDFVALADKMVREGGTTAFVLPLTAMAGDSWKKVRHMWARHYHDICIISLAAARSNECSWSADTSMAEILFIGKKLDGKKGHVLDKQNRRGVFVSINKRPENEMEAVEIARVINGLLRQKINKLEDGGNGATPVIIGNTEIGGMLDAPLASNLEDPWEISRIRDMTLAQISYSLVNSVLWLPHQTKKQAINLPVCVLGKFAKRGYISRDINEANRGPFDILPLAETESVPTYPCLWAHAADKESQIMVSPDRRGVVRKNMLDKSVKIWQTASRAHHNVDFVFGSQPLAVAMTQKPTIGGRAWTNVFGFKNKSQEDAYALWSNSTLGLLLYWWSSNKSQGDRGTISASRLPSMPTLDLTKLSSAQLTAARKGFERIKNKKLLPFYRANEDTTRAELDNIILVEVLNLPPTVLHGIAIVREKLCMEPSVRGGKPVG